MGRTEVGRHLRRMALALLPQRRLDADWEEPSAVYLLAFV